jgi:hypothetical protein
MADISVARKSGGQYTWVWMIVALVTVVGLMWWLAVQSEETRRAAVVDESPRARVAATPTGPAGEAAELAAIAAAPDTYQDRRVQLTDVSVAATLGSRAFWADVPGANPFLVVLSPDMAQPLAPAAGQTLDLQGTVAAVDEALLDQWVQSGAIQPGAREEAAFATHYLLADQASQ